MTQTMPYEAENLFRLLKLTEPMFVKDWKETSLAVQSAVDDLADVIEWLRETENFAQADRVRTITGRLARSVPAYPVFSGGSSPTLVRNLARTWPNQLSTKESANINAENARLSEENSKLQSEIKQMRTKIKRLEKLKG